MATVIVGRSVRLVPLRAEHAPQLAAAEPPADLTALGGPAAGWMPTWVEAALQQQRAGVRLPFLIIDLDTGAAAGSASLGSPDPVRGQVELGEIWTGRNWRAGDVAARASALLLRHAFTELAAARVLLRVDVRDEEGAALAARLGFGFEGRLERDVPLAGGSWGPADYYSILGQDWPFTAGFAAADQA